MQDRPEAHDLAGAVAEFLFERVRPAVPDDLRFLVLVAANTCAILAREAAAGETPAREELERLRGLLASAPDDPREARSELARMIRAGELDERWDEVLAVLRDSVRAKLSVAHPGWDEVADDGRG